MGIRFHLPGFRNNFPLNMVFMSMLKEFPQFFREGIEIGSFFGEFPTSLWNGGRYDNDDQCNAEYIKQVIKHINAQGVPIRYTFTNPLLTEEDLADEYCNFCMKAADNGMNEVLVVSPLLEQYIREKYPRFKINSSTCKEIKNMDALNEELKKDYNLVVLDYNLNNQFDLLEQIQDKGRCEILVNSCCIPNCPRRGEHYRYISKQQRICLANRELPEDKKKPVPRWSCSYGESNSLYEYRKYPTFVSPEDIWEKYVPMGFQNFKLEGRTANLFLLIDTYCYYFAKPEHRDEARLLLTANLQANKVIVVNKPKKGVFINPEKK